MSDLLDVLPAGAVRTPEEAAQALEESAARCDAYAALTDLGVLPPGLALLDTAHLLRLLARHVRQPSKPVRWGSAGEGRDELLRTLVERSRRMIEEPEGVERLYARTLHSLILDLASNLDSE